MNKIYTADFGNSNPHIALFENEELKYVRPIKEVIKEINDNIVIPSVVTKIEYKFKNSFNMNKLWHKNKFNNLLVPYGKSIGEDRLFSLSYLNSKINEGSILLIDAGTFIKWDFVTRKKIIPGSISPGINYLLENIKLGKLLPEITIDEFEKISINIIKNDKVLPKNTKEALTLGIINSILGNFDNLKRAPQYKNIEYVYFTGGNGELLHKIIILKYKLEAKVIFDKNLIHKSLFYLYLSYTKGQKSVLTRHLN